VHATARTELCYERRGRGRPLVLVHGWCLSWQSWLPVLDLLARERDVIAVDLPGFGASPPLPARDRYTRTRLCEELESFFTRLGLDRPDVAGNSLGGLLALDLANRDSVRTATGLCTPGFYGPISILRPALLAPANALARTPFLGRRLLPLAVSTLRRTITRRPESIEDDTWLAMIETGIHAHGGMRFVLHQSRSLPIYRGTPTVPVTLAWGSHDIVIPSTTALRARQKLPNARQVLLPDCGHIPMFDNPQLVAATLLDASN
jgi:pimeloyl-ACP methyl ester carboxylesterase